MPSRCSYISVLLGAKGAGDQASPLNPVERLCWNGCFRMLLHPRHDFRAFLSLSALPDLVLHRLSCFALAWGDAMLRRRPQAVSSVPLPCKGVTVCIAAGDWLSRQQSVFKFGLFDLWPFHKMTNYTSLRPSYIPRIQQRQIKLCPHVLRGYSKLFTAGRHRTIFRSNLMSNFRVSSLVSSILFSVTYYGEKVLI